VTIDRHGEEQVEVPYRLVKSARTVFEWDRSRKEAR
jgi:hypothetical protein